MEYNYIPREGGIAPGQLRRPQQYKSWRDVTPSTQRTLIHTTTYETPSSLTYLHIRSTFTMVSLKLNFGALLTVITLFSVALAGTIPKTHERTGLGMNIPSKRDLDRAYPPSGEETVQRAKLLSMTKAGAVTSPEST
ncbi:hypothetical protein K474DRAFT_1660705 [Panus rudis PR-1116 ss-1]|nr:hypothetical protein K474DRAFT_1660705 [Panus rudis PR-1116 ss-1]